jgi:dodecin
LLLTYARSDGSRKSVELCGATQEFVLLFSHRFVLIASVAMAAPPRDFSCLGAGANEGGRLMSVARVTEITSSSPKGFDEAMRVGIARATKTLQNVTGAWIKNQEVVIVKGKITEYRVRLKVTFILKE